MMTKVTVVDATLIAASSSTKNASGERDPDMKQSRKGNQWYIGMKAHIGVDVHSGMAHSVAGLAANVNDVTQAETLLHGHEQAAFDDAGYQGARERSEAFGPTWYAAMRPGLRRHLNPFIAPQFKALTLQKWTAGIRAKVEHPFRVLRRRFGYAKVRYRGLAKDTAKVATLFLLGNLFRRDAD